MARARSQNVTRSRRSSGNALRKAGGEAEVLEVQDRTHQELFAEIGDGDPATEAALSFIVQHSKP